MTSKLLEIIKSKYELATIDAGEMKKLKANGMTFDVEAYSAKGLGHVSIMRAKGFFGLMKMDTLIINPTELDLPLYSYDRIFAMGNDTLIVELYDTVIGEYNSDDLESVKARYEKLPERDPGAHWYDDIKLAASISKKGKKADSTALNDLALEHFEAYLSSSNRAADAAEKRAKSSYYVEGLLKNGGPSTDVFKKALGEEKTSKLFREILFGSEIK